MKLGTENRKEVIALGVLLVVAAIALWINFGPSGSAEPAAVTPAAPAATLAANPSLSALDPRLHLDQLEALRAIDYTGSGRDLFHFGTAPALAQNAAPQGNAHAAPVHPAPVQPVIPAGPAPPPPPPPIPLRFYGYAQAAGVPERIFLAGAQDTYVVSVGDTIEHRYQILDIGKVSVRVKDLQTSSEQELPLEQGGE